MPVPSAEPNQTPVGRAALLSYGNDRIAPWNGTVSAGRKRTKYLIEIILIWIQETYMEGDFSDFFWHNQTQNAADFLVCRKLSHNVTIGHRGDPTLASCQ